MVDGEMGELRPLKLCLCPPRLGIARGNREEGKFHGLHTASNITADQPLNFWESYSFPHRQRMFPRSTSSIRCVFPGNFQVYQRVWTRWGERFNCPDLWNDPPSFPTCHPILSTWRRSRFPLLRLDSACIFFYIFGKCGKSRVGANHKF